MNRKRIFMFLLAAWLCLFHAQAAEEEHTQIEKDSQQLLWALPGEARDLLQGITPAQAAGQWDTAIMQMIQRIDAHRFIASAVRSLMKMLLVAVMIGVLSGLRGAAGGNELPIITMAGALGMTGILLHDLRGILALCINTLEQTSVFSTTLLPVMAGAMTISGAPATATATQAATMLALDLLIRFITSLLAPAVCAYIAIITVNAALGNDILGGLAGFIKWMTTGSLKFILTIFIAYLSISGALSGSVDAVALKTAKFALSGSVPVVGGIISDATESMLTGMAAMKNAVGVFGMLGVLAICAAPFLQVGINYLLFKTGTAAISPICSGSLEKLMAGLSDSFGLMLGMIGTCCAVLFFELVFSIMMVKPI